MKTVKKVNLFLIGAAKCGTTSLFRYFEQHPSFYTTMPKEPRFFAHDINEKHPEYGFLISHEIAMTGQKGSGILFNNNKIHRGGFVKKGTRHMAQVNFSIGALR